MNLETERLNFRRYNDQDIDFLFHLLADSETVRYIGEGKTRDREGALNFLKKIYATYKLGPDTGLMIIEKKDDNIPIGHAGLIPQVVEGAEELEIGYWVSRDQWGNGYATEAARALKDYGVKQLEKQRMISLIQSGNTASKRVASKIGMELEKKIQLDGQNVEVYSVKD
ncbi:GNAT family N-acetyltransferase [Halobacillus massiliensis]|uniref:GNAT family N-acetyltransferase n=1 Tax=Halobacillus massiliensis TaxID=1926286 RepID=UPI0009E47564|nr:GNAT family N-acetyltransferase [Halobacillus massiliensis]